MQQYIEGNSMVQGNFLDGSLQYRCTAVGPANENRPAMEAYERVISHRKIVSLKHLLGHILALPPQSARRKPFFVGV